MNIAIVVFSLVIGVVAMVLMARTVSFKKLRAAQAEEKGA